MSMSKIPSTPSTSAAPSGSKRQPATDRLMSRRDQVVLILIALLTLAGLGFLAIQAGAVGEDAGARGADLEHVHGLGVDPATGTLYAGTHNGLFRLPDEGAPSRVAERRQDFMGFTVAGPGHFLASGHPGQGEKGPSSLGLIESTDGGQSWQPLSLTGEADFHALEYRHGQVYGVNAMTLELMVSRDMKNWDIRTTLPMADFAVSPESAEVILATTEQGLSRSEDGGRTFRLVQNAPVLLLVSWSDDGTIVGLDPDGTVYTSAGDGAAWEARARLDGSPEALIAISQAEIYAAAGGAVLASTDGGESFTARVGG